MRVLFVTRGVPHPANGGPGVRDAALIGHIAIRHDVRVLSLVDVPSDLEVPAAFSGEAVVAERGWRDGARAVVESRWLAEPFATRWYHDDELAGRLRRTVRDWAPDVVQVEHSFLAGFERDLRGSGPRTVLSLHNVGELQYRRMAAVTRGLSGESGPAPRRV